MDDLVEYIEGRFDLTVQYDLWTWRYRIELDGV